ncbi:MAG: 2-phosphosulfolactate phosphatase, partial [Bacteroidales bacterium]|nr:2-phosphosulfolactate phosphatase [Bacteroidales bacterium]
TDDLGSLVLQFYGSETGNIANKLQNCFHLKYLQANGYQQDIDYCLQPDQLDVVPVLKDGKMQKL